MRLPCSACLLLLIGTATARRADAQSVRPLEGQPDVLHYDVRLVPDPAAGTITGTERVEFQLPAASRDVEFDSGHLVVDDVTAENGDATFTTANGRLRVRWTDPLPARRTRAIRIKYHGAPRTGLTMIPEREQIYTVFSTSQWMVAVDAPSDRATLRLRVVVPSHWAATGSGQTMDRRPIGGGLLEYEWQVRSPAPSYTYGFAAGRFLVVVERHRALTLKFLGAGFEGEELRRIFRDTANMIDFFESRAGVPYPGREYSQVLTARGIGQEMSGMSVMPETYGREVLADERESWLAAHELAHQWWGNLVTCRDWTHFWLNEGVATFMVAAYKEHRWGRDEYLKEIGRIRARYEHVRDAGHDRPLVFSDWTKPTADDRTIVYQKGAYVLHLLREEIGDDAFWKGVMDYTRSNAGKPVETRDFQAAMERAAGRSLDRFFFAMVHGPLPR